MPVIFQSATVVIGMEKLGGSFERACFSYNRTISIDGKSLYCIFMSCVTHLNSENL